MFFCPAFGKANAVISPLSLKLPRSTIMLSYIERINCSQLYALSSGANDITVRKLFLSGRGIEVPQPHIFVPRTFSLIVILETAHSLLRHFAVEISPVAESFSKVL